MTKPKLIYILRSQCKECKLDKMIQFYRVPNGRPQEMFKAHIKYNQKIWPQKYGCTHKIEFTREIDKEYLWDLDNNEPVRREKL